VQAQSSDACKSEIFGYMMILMCLNIYHAEIIIITMLIYIYIYIYIIYTMLFLNKIKHICHVYTFKYCIYTYIFKHCIYTLFIYDCIV